MGFPPSLAKRKKKKHQTHLSQATLATETTKSTTTKTYFSTSSRRAKMKMICMYLKIHRVVCDI